MIKRIRTEFKDKFSDDKSESLSDRRFLKIIKILKVSAYTNDRQKVTIYDLPLMLHFLWSNPKNRAECIKIVVNIVREELYNENDANPFNDNIWL